MALNALDRHLALVGFMGAGKSTLAPLVAERLGRRSVDVDDELGVDIPALFAQGEEAFRAVEEPRTCELLARPEPAVLALGGGSIKSEAVRDSLAAHAFTVLIDVDVDTAWERVTATDRPLAQDEATFRRLNDERRPLYGGVADVTAADVDGVILAAAGVHHELGALERLGELVPGTGPVALVADSTVMGIHGPAAQTALGDRLGSTHELPPGEDAKQMHVLEQLWSELRLDRSGTVVALGGGALTDVAGFAAATYLRGVPWVAVPTTLVGQVDAGIGGKTAIDIPQGKNLVGAFHWPARVVIDEALLATLPERERRQGQAELIKTELLAGRRLDVRAAAAYKAALCLRDPHDRDVRQWLNLGHTFAHALEAAADFDLPHGEAVALGLLAALRLSGRETAPVVEALDPQPVHVDRERAWQALQRDKKRTGDEINLVLLGDDGPYVEARPADEVRAALDSLTA
ncbi:MAG: bifunctional shikimate kinase/3-dehydroquinate synthase [Gaiellaceae bacterium]